MNSWFLIGIGLMKFKLNKPAREFVVGHASKFKLKDCAHITLKPDEQVTFVTKSGSEYDLARKDWGYYATPSLNGRLSLFRLRAVLIKNRVSKKYHLTLVEKGKERKFKSYLKIQDYTIVCWMDNDRELGKIERKMREAKR